MKNQKIKVALIGYGYWGPNLLRNFAKHPNCEMVAVVEKRSDIHSKIQSSFPNVCCFDDLDLLFDHCAIDAIIIATPVHSHYSIAKKALLAGKHVLIEKPMTSSVEEAKDLISIAESRQLILMVDHTFLYTGAVIKMKELIENGEIGNPKYFDSTRINLGLFQPDVNVLWDLAPHDISILTYLVRYKPLSVNAVGVCHTQNGIENIAYLTINFEEDFIAHFNCSWTSPVKVRSTLIGGEDKMLVYNDLEPSEKIRIYNTSYSHRVLEEEKNRLLVDYRTGDVFIPKLENTEALYGVASDFIDCIEKGTEPVASKDLGLLVVQILEAAQKSIKNSGAIIYI
jgi:predicted dehydrogenase